jgi:hypothetical protein
VDVAAACPPPACTLPPELRARLLAAAAAAPGGVLARDDWVAVVDFDAPWQTAFVRLRGVPPRLVCRAGELLRYAARLHDVLIRQYARRGLPMPTWRGWAALLRRWPCLATARPPPRLTVRVLRPLA